MSLFKKFKKAKKGGKIVNVQIKTAFGEMAFDMPQDKALSLISLALTYAEGTGATAEPTAPHTDMEEEPPKAEEAPTAPMPTEKPKSRLEALFGNRSEWNVPEEETPQEPDDVGDEDPQVKLQEEYKGFLYIECEECGKTKAFCVKQPITFHRCKCGHETDLHDLIPVHVRCECDAKFTYRTNVRSNTFTMDCLSCGSPVDMELGAKEKAYVTMGRSRRRI